MKIKILFKSILKGIQSRLSPIIISDSYVLYLLSNVKWKEIKSVYIPSDFEDKDNVVDRIKDTLHKVQVFSFIHFYPLPYSFYYVGLKKYISGVGYHKFHGNNIILVAEYSFFTGIKYPYIEHEVLHAVGLLRNDHSNWEEYKDIAKYR